MTSTYYLTVFAGNSLPVVGVGVLSTLTSPLVADVVLASVVAALAVVALVWSRTRGRTTAAPTPSR